MKLVEIMATFQLTKNDETKAYHFALDYLQKYLVTIESSSDQFGHIVEQIGNLGHYNKNKEDINNQNKYSDFLISLQLSQYHPMASTSKFIK